MALMVLAALNPLMLFGVAKEVQLKSGERLLGEVLPESNEQTLRLRSKILGELKLPRTSIASIKELPAAKPAVVAKPAPKPAVAAKPAPKIKVAEAESKKEESLDILNAFKEFKTPASWRGNLRIGVNFSTGDRLWSENYARGQLSIQPKGSRNFYRFGGSYSYRKNENSNGTTRVANDKFDVSILYRRNLSKGWFIQNSLGYRVDNVKGIDHEMKESIGAGYKFKLFKGKAEFNIGSGIGLEDFQASKSNDLRNGQNYIANVFQEFSWKINKRTTLSQNFNYYKNLHDSNLYDFNFSSALRTRLTDVFGLELSCRKDFDSEVGGKQKDDTQWRSALVIYF